MCVRENIQENKVYLEYLEKEYFWLLHKSSVYNVDVSNETERECIVDGWNHCRYSTKY